MDAAGVADEQGVGVIQFDKGHQQTVGLASFIIPILSHPMKAAIH